MELVKQWWPVFVVVTILCWGAYVPTIHHGQKAFGSSNSALRAFLFVGVAYFALAGAILAYMAVTGTEPFVFTRRGVSISTLAGVLGALGALGVVFAIKNGGKPLIVAPLVFAGAPVINTIVSMIWDKPSKAPSAMFYLGILLACGGAALVLRFKPV
jgi:hypothetical protein